MPLIGYVCPKCGNKKSKFIRDAKSAEKNIECDKCKSAMNKSLSQPSSHYKVSIDNGVQSRAVEVDPNIMEINEERSNKNYKEE